MKIKRCLLIVVLLAFSFTCIYFMNDSYDRLARYQYEVNEEQRKVIEERLSDDDIGFMIQQKIKPELLMKYILLDNFKVRNTLYYETCALTQAADLQFIVNFVNTYKSNFKYIELESLVENYEYSTLSAFYEGAYTYFEDAKLVVSPKDVTSLIHEEETLYKYYPDNLVTVDNFVIPSASVISGESIQLKSEVIDPLQKMCDALSKTNEKTCGGLILTKGYISYENQVQLYEEAIVKYGFDNFKKYDDYPGQSIHQLGYTLTFIASEMEEDKYAESEQAKWLLQHAKEYGFEVVYPPSKADDANKEYQPFTLRYIGSNQKANESNEAKEVKD